LDLWREIPEKKGDVAILDVNKSFNFPYNSLKFWIYSICKGSTHKGMSFIVNLRVLKDYRPMAVSDSYLTDYS